MSLGMLKGGRYVNDRLNDYIIYKQGGRGGGGLFDTLFKMFYWVHNCIIRQMF